MYDVAFAVPIRRVWVFRWPIFPEREPVAATDIAPLDLFMTVLSVTNWPAIVPWYIDTLGLVPVLMDGEHKFAFLAAGQGRLGLKGI